MTDLLLTWLMAQGCYCITDGQRVFKRYTLPTNLNADELVEDATQFARSIGRDLIIDEDCF